MDKKRKNLTQVNVSLTQVENKKLFDIMALSDNYNRSAVVRDLINDAWQQRVGSKSKKASK